jgi:putative membrane protein
MIVVAMLVVTYRKFQFSNTAYILMSLWIFMHTIGAYYTFERVPFDRFNNFFGFERNMYDRVAHYIIGFYAYPLIEYLERKKLVNSK